MANDTQQRPAPFAPNYWSRLAYVVVIVYCIWAMQSLEISYERIVAGMDNAKRFLGAMIPPSFARWQLLVSNLLESLQVAIISSFFGVIFSAFVGLTAARNLMPAWLTWISRAYIAICRSFHPVIFAILFVKAVGFGPLAGILTLIFASIGFIGKLFAEAIEEISLKPVEAMRAVGASFFSVLIFAVLPQVLNRFIGFATYQTDVNLRNSTMIGIVGAGGIGGTLSAAFQRYDYDFVSAILIAIIALVMLSEILAQRVKRIFR